METHSHTKLQPRAEQIGSLRRPRRLLDARQRVARGHLPPDELRRIEDSCIEEAIKRQEATGIGILTDGEFRRDAWQTGLSDAVEGFEDHYPRRSVEDGDGTVKELEIHSKAIVGRLKKKGRIAGREVNFLAERVPGRFKITMPSPLVPIWNSFKLEESRKSPYRSREEVTEDLLRIYADEIGCLVDEAVRYVQLDWGFSRYLVGDFVDRLAHCGSSADAVLERDIQIENECYRLAVSAGMTAAMHVCRGSRTRVRAGRGYDWLSERLFDRIEADRLLLEYDSAVAGGFEVLRYVPPGKTIVLGLVTSKDGELEDADALVRRINEAAKFCPLEQLALSPQCGFGGSADNDFMSEDEQWAKLALVAEVALRVWGTTT